MAHYCIETNDPYFTHPDPCFVILVFSHPSVYGVEISFLLRYFLIFAYLYFLLVLHPQTKIFRRNVFV